MQYSSSKHRMAEGVIHIFNHHIQTVEVQPFSSSGYIPYITPVPISLKDAVRR